MFGELINQLRGSVNQQAVVLRVALPNIPYTDRGGSGPVDGVGGPGG